MATQRLGSVWKGRAWDDGNPIPRVTLPDATLAEAMAAMGYGWNATLTAFQKLTVDNTTGGLSVYVAGQASTAVTGPLTDAQLRATPVPVSGTVTSNAGTNLNTSALALDATLTGGTQKSKLVDTGGTNVAGVSAAGRLSVDASGVAVPVTDNAGSLTVDAPVGTPAFVRLSDGAAAITTLPVSLATNTPDVTDRAARLLGVVDKGKVWDGTNIAAVKAASVIAAATDPALVVQQSPQRGDASTLAVTATAGVNTALTLTLPSATGLFHYITSIQIVKLYSVIGVAAGAGNLITTTNIPGSVVWTTEQLASAAGTAATVVDLKLTTPLKSTTVATNTTIVCPQQLQTIWRINVTYYTAP